jgi:hypothetical protein
MEGIMAYRAIEIDRQALMIMGVSGYVFHKGMGVRNLQYDKYKPDKKGC